MRRPARQTAALTFVSTWCRNTSDATQVLLMARANQHVVYVNRTRRNYRENAIAIESEARDSLNVYGKAGRRAFAHKECNLHCDVRVAAENKRTLPPFESLYSFWIMSSQRSRRRDKKKLSALFKQQHYSMANAHKHTLFDEAATTSITTAKQVNLSQWPCG